MLKLAVSSFALLCLTGMVLAGLNSAAQDQPRTAAAAQQPLTADTILPAAKLREDLAILKDAYTTLHPGRYRYNTPEQISTAFATAAAEFDRDRSLRDAFVVFSQLTATFRCGHSFCNPANQGQGVCAALIESGPRVPFLFKWLDGRLIVTEQLVVATAGQSAIARGSEILSINDVAVSDILSRMMTIAGADGSNDGKRAAYLQVDGDYDREAFDIYLPLLYPQFASSTEFTFQWRAADGVDGTVTLPAQTHADRAALVKTRLPETREDAALWTLSRARPDIALLNMPTWVMYNSKWDWAANLNDTFA